MYCLVTWPSVKVVLDPFVQYNTPNGRSRKTSPCTHTRGFSYRAGHEMNVRGKWWSLGWREEMDRLWFRDHTLSKKRKHNILVHIFWDPEFPPEGPFTTSFTLGSFSSSIGPFLFTYSHNVCRFCLSGTVVASDLQVGVAVSPGSLGPWHSRSLDFMSRGWLTPVRSSHPPPHDYGQGWKVFFDFWT